MEKILVVHPSLKVVYCTISTFQASLESNCLTLLNADNVYPCRACYWAMRYDGKARVECNLFERFYNCKYICESCLSQRRTSHSNPALWFFDFRESSPRHLTAIDDATYRQTCKKLSPYHCIPGWSLGTCLRDLLHVVFLGTAKDLVPSLLADWLDYNLLGDPQTPMCDRLRAFSIEMHQAFRRERILEPQLFKFLCAIN